MGYTVTIPRSVNGESSVGREAAPANQDKDPQDEREVRAREIILNPRLRYTATILACWVVVQRASLLFPFTWWGGGCLWFDLFWSGGGHVGVVMAPMGQAGSPPPHGEERPPLTGDRPVSVNGVGLLVMGSRGMRRRMARSAALRGVRLT